MPYIVPSDLHVAVYLAVHAGAEAFDVQHQHAGGRVHAQLGV